MATPLPKGWGSEEPRGPSSAEAIVRHRGAWCRIHEFEREDANTGYTECISRAGIVGSSYRPISGMGQRCGDVP